MNPALARLYRRLPRMTCKGLCHHSCTVIAMMPLEFEALATDPIPEPETLTCPLLVNNRCSRYESRPLICRSYGMLKRLRCPHGCRPKRWMDDGEFEALGRAIYALLPGNIRSLHPEVEPAFNQPMSMGTFTMGLGDTQRWWE